jgi:hypothetical protein
MPIPILAQPYPFNDGPPTEEEATAALESNNVSAMGWNLKRARQKWGSIRRLLLKMSASPTTMARFYKALFSQCFYSVRILGFAKRKLESFHRRCAHDMNSLLGSKLQAIRNQMLCSKSCGFRAAAKPKG